jgi:glyoxylase-like metal-dependent hydrolase (beta-lactamase superfamily II)
VLVYGAGEGAVITGDAAHHPLELEHPDWSPSADDDREQSARSRAALVERIEAEGLIVLGGHFPAPHAGRLVRVESRRVYRPLAD